MKIWTISGDVQSPSNQQQLADAAAILRDGGLVAFPTETVYGLGANATDDGAVRGIFAAKHRPADNPLIVHIADLAQLPQVVDHPESLSATAMAAARRFWPGPLTLVLPAADRLAPSVRPGLNTVGIRIPSHPVARSLLRLAGCPVAAPSANQSGRPSPTTAGDVVEDMEGRIAGVVDGGACEVGVESTVVRITDAEAVIFRPGGITLEDLQSALGIPVRYDEHLENAEAAPASPGMKYRHYAPNAQVHVWWGNEEGVAQAMRRFVGDHAGARIAGISAKPQSRDPRCVQWWNPPAGESYVFALTHSLFHLLRTFDQAGVDHIVIEGVDPTGYGKAVMNRLQKAAEGRVHRR